MESEETALLVIEFRIRKGDSDPMTILEEPIKGTPTIKNYIDGDWVESKGEILDVVNPVMSRATTAKPKTIFFLIKHLSFLGFTCWRFLLEDCSPCQRGCQWDVSQWYQETGGLFTL